MTKKQHYVPRVYLESFSTKNEINKICSYPLDSKYADKKCLAPISTRSICSEDNLYENLEIAPVNDLENKLGSVENNFKKNLTLLIRKINSNKDNMYALILTSKEKEFWRIWTLLQYLRIPCRANNFNEYEKNLFLQIEKWIQRAPINILFFKNSNIFTSDNPVMCCFNEEHKNILLPISPNISLCFGEIKENRGVCNRVIMLNQFEALSINTAIINEAKKYIFSSNPFSEKDINLIKLIKKSPRYETAKGYIIDCLIEDYKVSPKDAEEAVEKSRIKNLFEQNEDMAAHTSNEDYAERIYKTFLKDKV